jgi:hypothetical protein
MSQPASAWTLRAVQLDLARQMETVDFICRYAERAADWGFNTLVLYLEGRIRTPAFPHRPPTASYAPADMRRVVAAAACAGVDVVPVVSVLGHAEQFLACDALAGLAEEREGGSRWGGGGRSTFCPSQPGTWAFLDAYLAELADIFPAPHLHLGCDEDWNLGFCPLCRERWRRDGLDRLFTDHVLRAHALATRLGKRLWIWDDMFEFWPDQLERLPRDTVLCHWNYDAPIEPEGCRAHFRNRWRRDWLGLYEDLGFATLVCPVVRGAGGFANTASFTAYARRHHVLGGLLTQWEMSGSFHEELAPLVAAAGRLWSHPEESADEALAHGLQTTLPGAGATVRAAADTLLRAQGGPLRAAAPSYCLGPITPAEEAQRDLQRAGLRLLDAARAAAGPLPCDETLDELRIHARLGLVGWVLRELVPAAWDPCRPAADTPRLQARLDDCRQEVAELLPLRREQQARRRPGCHPADGAAQMLTRVLAFLDEVAVRLAGPPAEDEWRLVLRLCLPDDHGSPRLRVSVPGEDGGEQELLAGCCKPPAAAGGGLFTVTATVRCQTPPARLRLEAWGYGGQGIAYVELQSPRGHLRPCRLLNATGPVYHPEALLRDDAIFAWCGCDDMRAALLEPERALARATLDVELESESRHSA